MFNNGGGRRSLACHPYTALLVALRRLWTVRTFGRLVFVFLMLATWVIASWTGLAMSPAYAASLNASHTSTPLFQDTTGPSVAHWHARPPQASVRSARQATLSGSAPFDGLGDLKFYTYITFKISDRVELKVNVANGNLVVHTTDEHMRGTGIDVSLDGYYNSQASYSADHGNNWVFSFGHDVFLDTSNASQGVVFHGPSGYSAFFAAGSGGAFTDHQPLDASLVKNGDGSYTITYHHSGQKLNFSNTVGNHVYLTSAQDKHSNTITSTYGSQYNNLVSLTDTQQRSFAFSHNTVSG